MAGAITHFEIHAADPQRAMRFYREALGWSAHEVPGVEQGYWMLFPTGEDPAAAMGTGPSRGIGGGMMVRQGPPPAPDAPVHGYVCICEVDDHKATYAAVREHGGAIALEPFPVPGVGMVFYAKDTEGNLFGVLEPEAAPAAPPS